MEEVKAEIVYLDANVFILAIANNGELGKKSRAILTEIQDGRQKAVTSTLTFDEVVWKIFQLKNFDEALKAAHHLLKMPYLSFLNVDRGVLSRSLDLMARYRIYPRDAIHAACALNSNLSIFISEDSDFDSINELNRKSIHDFKIPKPKV